MLSTSTSFPACHRHSRLIALALLLPFMAKADLKISVVTAQNGSQVTADFMVSNFDDIVSMQFPVVWNPTELAFVSVTDFNLPGGSTMVNFGQTAVDEGSLRLSWNEPTGLSGVALPNCSPIFRITFNSINGNVPPILVDFGDPAMVVEVYTFQWQELTVAQTSDCENLSQIAGKLFQDENGNCIKDEGEASLKDWVVKIERDGANEFYCPADDDGNYFFNSPSGHYDITLVVPEGEDWSSCQTSFSIGLDENTVIEQHIGATLATGVSNANDLTINGLAISLAPNPVSSNQFARLTLNADSEKALTIQALSATGELLAQWEQKLSAGDSSLDIPVRFPKGLHLLKLIDERGVSTTLKLVVN